MAWDLSHLAFGTSPWNGPNLQVVSALPHNPDLSLKFVLNPVLELLLHLKVYVVMCERCGPGIKKYWSGPGWCGSVDWAPACEPKGHQFDSQLGHMPGLWARSPVGWA